MTEIDYKLIDPQTLAELLSEIVLREGTDYGIQEISHHAKVDQLMRKLESGKATIVYYSDSDYCDLIEK